MKKFAVGLALAVAGTILWSDLAQAQLRPSNDPFESRRRDAAYRENLRKQQAQANRRVVPTFTIPQPALNQGYYNQPYHNPYGNRYVDPRHFDSDYVLIPGHYQNIYGRLVWVPPHYQYVPR